MTGPETGAAKEDKASVGRRGSGLTDPARPPTPSVGNASTPRPDETDGHTRPSWRIRPSWRARVTERARRGQRGSITAETAVAFPALVIVLVVALWGVGAAAAQVACVDAARAGARAAARGEPETEVRTAVRQAAPANAHVTVSRTPATTTVVVTAQTRPPLKALFPALRLRAQAVAATEPEGSDTPTP
jgi:hypothetical protein